MITDLEDWTPPPACPPDVHRGALVLRNMLRAVGLPPPDQDGHRVAVALVTGHRVSTWTWSFTEALEHVAQDPEVRTKVCECEGDLGAFVPGITVLVFGEAGDYWCAPVGLGPRRGVEDPEA
jgi:hypothetical protein